MPVIDLRVVDGDAVDLDDLQEPHVERHPASPPLEVLRRVDDRVEDLVRQRFHIRRCLGDEQADLVRREPGEVHLGGGQRRLVRVLADGLHNAEDAVLNAVLSR